MKHGLSTMLRSLAVAGLTVLMCSCQTWTTRTANHRGPGPAPAEKPVPPIDPPKPVIEPKPSAKISDSEVHAEETHLVSDSNSNLAVSSHANCPTCRPRHVGLPPSAFGGAWGTEFVRPPIEEYVCNGGDQNLEVVVKQDWSVHGLHPGDTVVHYDTIDGRTLIEPSNDVCLYAPRFAAVRKVYGLVAHEQHDRVAGVEIPVGAEQSSELGQPTTVTQPLQPIRRHSVKTMQSFVEKTHGIGIENAQRPAIAAEEFLPFEDLVIIRRGVFDNTEKVRLWERLQAAIAWTSDLPPQVLIDNKTAVQLIGNTSTESVYVYELPAGKSRLRVVKIASKQNAKPGELVEFTLRFDNVGDQTIGNVTVIDRLHDRLEYVPETQRCSLKAEFLAEDEEGSTQVLRWEIEEPMKVGQGGLIRFTCRVR